MTVRFLQRLANFTGRYAYAAGLVAYSFTFGLLSARRRHLVTQLARAANYAESPRPTLPKVAFDVVTSPDTSVVLPFAEGTDGNVSLLELLVLARCAKEREPLAVFEIGTFNGRTTAALAANAPQNATIFTLDLPKDAPTRFALASGEDGYVKKHSAGEMVHRSPYAPKVRQLFGDSAVFDFSPYQVDLVFIDGSHAYEYVLNDSRRALAMLRGGRGVILWHDLGEWEGVTRALNELHQTDARFVGLRHVAGTTLAILEV